MHRRRCTQLAPMRRQSSQPVELGETSRTWSRWVHAPSVISAGYVAPRMEWLSAFRSRVVSRLPDGIARRRPGDAARVVVAIALLTVASVHAFHPAQVE